MTQGASPLGGLCFAGGSFYVCPTVSMTLSKEAMMMLTGSVSRAARALVELSREQLSTQCPGLDPERIAAFERGLGELDADARAALQAALERAGAVFIPENGGGAGVRLKFTRSEARRIAVLEGEGGLTGNDDVP